MKWKVGDKAKIEVEIKKEVDDDGTCFVESTLYGKSMLVQVGDLQHPTSAIIKDGYKIYHGFSDPDEVSNLIEKKVIYFDEWEKFDQFFKEPLQDFNYGKPYPFIIDENEYAYIAVPLNQPITRTIDGKEYEVTPEQNEILNKITRTIDDE